MKKRLRVTDAEAKILGLEIKKKEGKRNAKYTVNDEQLKELYIYNS
jgi:hypothetical protein